MVIVVQILSDSFESIDVDYSGGNLNMHVRKEAGHFDTREMLIQYRI